MSDRPGSHQLRLVPLGGLGEIGMNCLALEHDDSILVVDCGTNLPRDDLGIDVIHADFTWLRQRRERVHGVFLTHGHEDHIGGLPYLLREVPAPIWGPPYALGLIRRRLLEHEFDLDEVALRPVAAGNTYDVGSFRVTPLAVSHSTVEAAALCMETRVGTVLHSGDFNLDPDPPDNHGTDVERLAEIGERGVMLLLSDSTNIDIAERPGSEHAVAERLRDLVCTAKGCVFVSMFASNLHRLIALGQIARECGRQICLLGRSMNAQVEVATQQRRLDWPSHLLVAPEQVPEIPRNRVLVIAGGSQAEPESALARLAKGCHPVLAVEAEDAVVLSSRIIPGNEPAVNAMICALLRRGAKVHSVLTDPEVHTSGHAGRSELLRLLELVRPCCFVPIHGTLHHLLRHAELARAAGVPEVMVIENGTTLVVDGDGLHESSRIPHGRVAIDDGGHALAPEMAHQRAELGRIGVVAVSVALDTAARLVAEPRVTALGVPALDGQSPALGSIVRDLSRALRRLRRTDPKTRAFADQLRRTVRRRILDLSGSRPIIEVHVLIAEER